MASQSSQVDQYRKSAVNGASPLQLVIMLYDGAFKFIANGRRAMANGDTFEQNKQIQKAQRIVAELISCLDMKKGGEIAENLMALYTFCYNKLVESNLGDNPEGLDQVTEVLSNLRVSWVEIEQGLRAKKEHRVDAA